MPTDQKTSLSRATLLVIRGADQGSGSRSATTGPAGRGGRNEIRIGDTEVSRQHAEIHCSDGLFVLSDRGSANGTFVNGTLIR